MYNKKEEFIQLTERNTMKKVSGFTLAEVLIAMAVLGIVSALTIPHLMGDTTKKQYITAFKATMNNLQGAAKTFKAENGYDYTGNRTVTSGSTTIRNILEQKLGAKLVKLTTANQWQVQGLIASDYETIAKEDYNGTDSIKTEALLTSAATKVNDVDIKNNALTLAFGHGNDTANKATGGKYYGDTYQLPNGSYILVPTNTVGCNFKNVRWEAGTTNAYKTPDITKTSNADANTNLCLAFIDVNGPKGPNRITNCATKSVIISPISTASCPNMAAKEVSDVFPIFFYDDSVAPASAATYTVLNDLLAD